MKTAIWKLSDINPAPYNPRKDLRPTDEEYKALKKSISSFGFVVPLVVNERNGVLISGHQRLKVLQEGGATETEVVLVDLDSDKEKALNVAMNKLGGFWDYFKLQELFKEFEPSELTVTGYSRKDVDNILKTFKPFDRSEMPEAELPADVDVNNSVYGGGSAGTVAGSDVEDSPKQEYRAGSSLLSFRLYFSFSTREGADDWLLSNGIANYEWDGNRVSINCEER